MLSRQRRQLLFLSGALAILLGVIAFGPEPTTKELTPEELAEWTVPVDDTGLPPGVEYRIVGDPTVDWFIIEEVEVILLDPNDPFGPAIEIVTEEDACWMPKAGADNNPYI